MKGNTNRYDMIVTSKKRRNYGKQHEVIKFILLLDSVSITQL